MSSRRNLISCIIATVALATFGGCRRTEPTEQQLRQELDARSEKATNAKSTRPRIKELDSLTRPQLLQQMIDRQKSIYGTDDRQEWYEMTPNLQALSNSVAALFDGGDLVESGGQVSISSVPLGVRFQLCSSQKFVNEPSAAYCTGFVVGPDLIATAGHCVDEQNVTSKRVVFGYRMLTAGNSVLNVPAADVYKGSQMVAKIYTDANADWALFRVDHPFVGHPALAIRRQGTITKGEPVFVIGHPSGLPVKYAGNATVLDSAPKEYFRSNLDTFGGNSGSPIFNANTGIVEGVLVRGGPDYRSSGSCNVAVVCPTTGCDGEDGTRTTEFCQYLPQGNISQLK
jgi:V8-like Glu-specific endopeptidase